MKIAQDILSQKANIRLFTISPKETITTAINQMVAQKVGAILVKDKETIIGIWTERDLLYNMTLPGFDPGKQA